MRKKFKLTLTEDRDMHILVFLYDWKLATTAAISARFFPLFTTHAAYNRLTQLKKAGYVRIQTDLSGRNPCWTLTQMGFEAIKEHVGEQREVGFKSENPHHDLVCMAIQLGDWIYETPKGVKMITEQELRRTPYEFIPPWAKISGNHRPDGFWKIEKANGPLVVALEVELSRKAGMRYQSVAHVYSRETHIHYVLWLVQSHAAANRIHNHIQKSQAERTSMHLFAFLDDLRSMGWQAKLYQNAKEVSTITEFLSPDPSPDSSANAMQRRCTCTVDALLTPRLRTFAKLTLSSPTGDSQKTATG